MEIIRNHIHMDRVKYKAVSQMNMEEDVNLPENNPDLKKVIFKEGNVIFSDVKVWKDHVTLKGTLEVPILYLTEDDEEKLARLEGHLDFEETVFAEGVAVGDTVDVTWKVEDLCISVINSRKLSVRSIVTFCLQAEELFDEEAACDVSDAGEIEYHLQHMEISGLAFCKRDVYRIRQEMELPSHMPNIFRLIWQSVRITAMNFKPMDDKISVSGELSVFLLYESTQENDNLQYYESVIPFADSLDCQGSRETMIPDIKYCVSTKKLQVCPDMDGEERGFSMEISLDLCIKMYAEKKIPVISDVYGTKCEVIPEVKEGVFRKILVRNNGICRLNEKIPLEEDSQILQLIHSEGDVFVEDCIPKEDGVQVEGVLALKCIYVNSDDKTPYASLEEMLPFSYFLEGRGTGEKLLPEIKVRLEQLAVNMPEAKELEVKAALDVEAILFEEFTKELVTDVQLKELNPELQKQLPGIAVHVVSGEDTLWKIGKKYYISVDKIKEMNGLSGEELTQGEKLLIVKER